jgi:sarcosine oxidase subunit alpha
MTGQTGPSFRFRRRTMRARPGESLARHLFRDRIALLQRSIRYHRPRAPFCGVGFCTQCLVRVNGTPNVRACRYFPKEGDRVETENAWPSPSRDLLGALDFVFYRGLDTLHGFVRPGWAAPLYHRVVRRLSGYGTLADAPAPASPGATRARPADVLVVGAGRAGRAAAARLAGAGRSTVLLDRGDLAAPPDGVEAVPHTTALFLPPPRPTEDLPFRLVATHWDRTGVLFEARQVLVATGAYDAGLLFAGNDRPGVVTAEGALALFGAGATDVPFRHALLFGGGDRAAEMLDRFGPRIDTIVAPGAVRPDVARRASEWEIAIYPRTLLDAARGRGRVRAARLRSRGDGRPFTLAADLIVLAHRRLPHGQLLFQAGAAMHWRAEGGAYYPTLSDGCATSVPGLFVAGEAAGFADAVGIEASGIAAAEAALGRAPRLADLPPRLAEAGLPEIQGYYRELLRGPRSRGKWIGCLCEDVLLGEVEDAHRRGFRGIEVIKRQTSLGTGLCQGRYCVPEALLLLSILEDRPPSAVGYITQRPPVVPASLSALAELPEADGVPTRGFA